MDDASLLNVLLLLDFLNSHGRQHSAYEQQLALDLCKDLMDVNYGLDTKLLILHFMTSFDSSTEDNNDKTQLTTYQQYAAFVKGK